MNQILTQLLKSIVTSKGLVKTGALRDSIKVFTNFSGNVITVNVESVDYFKYLISEYGILPDFVNSTEFSSEVEGLLQGWTEKLVQDTLDGKMVDVVSPVVRLTFNGQ